jgi:hypothetical protein
MEAFSTTAVRTSDLTYTTREFQEFNLKCSKPEGGLQRSIGFRHQTAEYIVTILE